MRKRLKNRPMMRCGTTSFTRALKIADASVLPKSNSTQKKQNATNNEK